MDALRQELEARVHEQLARMDALILDADREIERLQLALAEARRSVITDRALTPDEQQQCFALVEAGFTRDEIARGLSVPVERVHDALDEFRRAA
jgi:DNA-directed RNA polymerase specialized sigma24 family protein